MKQYNTIKECLANVKSFKVYKKQYRNKYFNNRICFDIEVSSFYVEGIEKEPTKRACCYAYIFGIDGNYKIGRSLEEFIKDVDYLEYVMHKKDPEAHIVIWVHNLAYEFQFIRKYFEIKEILANDERKIIYAVTQNNIEFRCSYMLSGYSLKKVGENLRHHNAKKMVGDLDYSLLRGSTTPLTEKEIGYIREDYEVLDAYIEEELETYLYISRLPYTKTGKVRKFCRKVCNEKGNYKKRYIKNLVINDAQEYMLMRRAFMGGFTHANSLAVNNLIRDVTSIDFTSSYPAVMVSEMFPMSRGQIIEIKSLEQIKELSKRNCLIFDIEFWDLESTFIYESYLSSSHGITEGATTINNGRIVKTKYLKTTITNIDLDIIEKVYKWSKCKIGLCYVYKKWYLPTPFVKSILMLYKDKTTLKGIEDKIAEYMNSKEMLNSCYGMTVTDIIKPEIEYNDEEGWHTEEMTLDKRGDLVEKYNNQRSRFLFYPWGVFITAYARRNLWSGILEFGEDYCYSDTDSIKGINYEKHKVYVEKYNDICYHKLEVAMSYHKLDISLCAPTTIKGEKKIIGVWDYDGHYDMFKTLGSKRYMVYNNKGLSLTISGVNKTKAVPYLLKKYKNNIQQIFDSFSDGFEVPSPHAGKQILTYIDYETSGEFMDYLGNKQTYHELSSVHMEEGSYTLTMSDEYLKFLAEGVKIDYV